MLLPLLLGGFKVGVDGGDLRLVEVGSFSIVVDGTFVHDEVSHPEMPPVFGAVVNLGTPAV